MKDKNIDFVKIKNHRFRLDEMIYYKHSKVSSSGCWVNVVVYFRNGQDIEIKKCSVSQVFKLDKIFNCFDENELNGIQDYSGKIIQDYSRRVK